jgi:hypothetical protein
MTGFKNLDSLQIDGFRAFRRLRIEHLGQVNLIVGKNNVGKTCLLEALLTYATRGSLATIRRLLESRDEASHLPVPNGEGAKYRSIKWLFHGRRDLGKHVGPIQIGPIDSPDNTLFIEVIWYREQLSPSGQQQLQFVLSEASDPTEVLVPGLRTRLGTQTILNYPLQIDIPDISRVAMPKMIREMELPHVFVPASGLTRDQGASMWDKIALTRLEKNVLAALRIIAPGVERINLVGSQGDGERIALAKMAGVANPLPLRSLGEGMNRLFGIALALVSARDGILLVDEVDSGLYYSVQPDLWRLIFRTARQVGVQVFATTHSWDCVAGFQQAVREDGRGKGLLLSLREKKGEPGNVVAITFDSRELTIATREQIEVR